MDIPLWALIILGVTNALAIHVLFPRMELIDSIALASISGVVIVLGAYGVAAVLYA